MSLADKLREMEKQLAAANDLYAACQEKLQLTLGKLTEADRENAEFRRLMSVEGDMQRRLLPPDLDSVGNVDIGRIWQPKHKVGGDWYDILDLDTPTRIGIVLGDISGKGLEAFPYMVMNYTIIHAALTQRSLNREGVSRIMTPQEIVIYQHLLFQHLMRKEPDAFAAMTIGFLDTLTGVFEYSRAGNDWIMLYDKDGHQLIDKGGIGQVVGMTEELPKQDLGKVIIPPGGVLLLCTDGAYDQFCGSEQLGRDSFITTVSKNVTLPPQQMLEVMLESINTYRRKGEVDEEPQYDDITMLAFKMRI